MKTYEPRCGDSGSAEIVRPRGAAVRRVRRARRPRRVPTQPRVRPRERTSTRARPRRPRAAQPRVERVEARGQQAAQAVRNGKRADVTDELVDAVVRHDHVAVDQRADRLDREQRNALCLSGDRRARVGRHAGTSASTRRPSTRRRAARAPSTVRLRPTPQPGRFCIISGRVNTRMKIGRVAGPVGKVVEEVEHARVGVLRVLDQQDDRSSSAIRSKNSRQPANSSSRLSGVAPSARDADQRAEPRADVARSSGSATNSRHALGELRRGDVARILVLDDAEPLPHDLGERPERDPLAVGTGSGRDATAPSRPGRRGTSRTPSPAATCRRRRVR